VHQEVDQPEAAEDAYRKALAIRVQLGDRAGLASTLAQLAALYDDFLDRPEEAVVFFRQSLEYVEGNMAGEGLVRNNLASTLRRLGRLDEARHEILRAIDCQAQIGHASRPWVAWYQLAHIETDSGNVPAAAAARAKAIESYLAYRRDGGENHEAIGRLVVDVTQTLRAEGPDVALSLLHKIATAGTLRPSVVPFFRAFEAVVGGSRDRARVDTPDLEPTMVAELLFLIETLEQSL
jgi:tetratricopeptide (TPR) repeat protein